MDLGPASAGRLGRPAGIVSSESWKATFAGLRASGRPRVCPRSTMRLVGSADRLRRAGSDLRRFDHFFIMPIEFPISIDAADRLRAYPFVRSMPGPRASSRLSCLAEVRPVPGPSLGPQRRTAGCLPLPVEVRPPFLARPKKPASHRPALALRPDGCGPLGLGLPVAIEAAMGAARRSQEGSRPWRPSARSRSRAKTSPAW